MSRILIVEDNERNLKLAREILQGNGFSTLEAREARAGIALAQEHVPDLILMDIQLPGMNGIEALKALRAEARTAAIPVIAVDRLRDDQGHRHHHQRRFRRLRRQARSATRRSSPPCVQPWKGRAHERAHPRGGRHRFQREGAERDPRLRPVTHVISASNGVEALAKMNADPPDLVLLDVVMAGLSGYEVCRQIRSHPATSLLPVIMVTVLDPRRERVAGIEAGADDFLSPIQPAGASRAGSLAASHQGAAGTAPRARPKSWRNGARSSSRASPSSWTCSRRPSRPSRASCCWKSSARSAPPASIRRT
jgi:CheY-like chemotaxis protein